MPAHVHSGSTQVEGTARIYNGSNWSDEGDSLWAHDGSQWQLIQPYEDSALLPPENLTLLDLGAETVTIGWDNPVQPTIQPTDVQMRIVDEIGIWIEYTMPVDEFTWPTLIAETPYQFQVRYVVRVDGIVTLTSATRSLFFQTLAPDAPSLPGPDPGGGPTGSIIRWPSGGGGDCDWEYIVQELDLDWIWADTLVTGTHDGDIEEMEIDFVAEGIACGTVCRLKYREVCSGIPGAYEYGGSFVVACDYTDDCGGVAISASFAKPAFADAILAMPQICWDEEAGRQKIEDYITGQEYNKGPGYGSPGFSNGDWSINGRIDNADQGTATCLGYNGNLQDINAGVDFSAVFSIFIHDQPPSDLSGGTKLLTIGNRCTFKGYSTGAGFKVSCVMPRVGGGAHALHSTTLLTLNAWHTVGITVDQDGNKILYVEGIADQTSTNVAAAAFDDMTSELVLSGNDSCIHRAVGCWDRVLSAAEMFDIYDPATAPYGVSFDVVTVTATATVTLTGLTFRANDVVYAYLQESTANATNNTAPAGWESIGAMNDGRAHVYAKVMVGNETSLTLAASTTAAISMVVMRKVDTTNLFGFWKYQTSQSVSISAGTSTAATNSTTLFDDIVMQEGYTAVMLGSRPVAANYLTVVANDSSDNAAFINELDYDDMFTDASASRSGWAGIVENFDDHHTRTRNQMGVAFASTSLGVGHVTLMVPSPRTAQWLETPHVVELVSVATSSNVTAVNIPIPASKQVGDMFVYTCQPWVWDVPGGVGPTGVDADATLLGAFGGGAGSTRYFAFYAIYALAHGTTYTIIGPGTATNTYSRYYHCARVVNHGGSATGGMYRNNGTFPTIPDVAQTLAANENDLLLTSAFARADTAGLVFSAGANPEAFEIMVTQGKSAGGAGGSDVFATLVAPSTKTYTFPIFDHVVIASTGIGVSQAYVAVAAP